MTSPAERHVVVPVEPTDEMLNAGYDWDDHVTGTETHPRNRGLYRAMLSAAPPVQMEAVAYRIDMGHGYNYYDAAPGKLEKLRAQGRPIELLYASPVPPSERDDINDDIERMSGIEEDMREQASGEQSGWLLKCADQLRDRIRSLKVTVAHLVKERDYAVRWANRAVDDVKEASAVEQDDIIEMCAKVAKRYALMAERRSQEYLADSPALAAALDKFEAATEIEAEILSLKSQPAQESGEGK